MLCSSSINSTKLAGVASFSGYTVRRSTFAKDAVKAYLLIVFITLLRIAKRSTVAAIANHQPLSLSLREGLETVRSGR